METGLRRENGRKWGGGEGRDGGSLPQTLYGSQIPSLPPYTPGPHQFHPDWRQLYMKAPQSFPTLEASLWPEHHQPCLLTFECVI